MELLSEKPLHMAAGHGGQIVRKVPLPRDIGRDSEREGRVRRNSAKIITNGVPARGTLAGANFWSRAGKNGPMAVAVSPLTTYAGEVPDVM